MSSSKLIKDVQGFLDKIQDAKDRKNEVSERQTIVNNMLQDIYHYNECNEKPRSCDANKYFKQMGVLRRERRSLSDEYELLDRFIETCSGTTGMLINAKNSLGQIMAKHKKAKYKTRVMVEDFGEEMRHGK